MPSRKIKNNIKSSNICYIKVTECIRVLDKPTVAQLVKNVPFMEP